MRRRIVVPSFSLRREKIRSIRAPRLHRAVAESLETRTLLSGYTVNATTDTGAGSGTTGDLRYCVDQATSNAGPDTIDFDSTVFATPQTINLTHELVVSDIAITGPAAGVTLKGSTSRVVRVQAAVTASMSNLTLTGGVSSDVGGGLYVQSSAHVTMTNCSIKANKAAEFGGGISLDNLAGLTLNRCTISNNQTTTTAPGQGGGIYSPGMGEVHLTDCTINNNTATDGGGISVGSYGASIVNDDLPSNGDATVGVTLTNCTLSGNTANGNGGGLLMTTGGFLIGCTISGNTATGDGGGIATYNFGPFMVNCTVTNNRAANVGGGIRLDSTIGNAWNTIIAGNFRGPASGPSPDDVAGPLTTQSCLIGGNAMLESLGSNGGPTLTHRPKLNSPAVNGGNSTLIAGATTDQRGSSRLVGTVDIGAVELKESLVVTTLTDEDNGTSDALVGTGTSLREAINYANAHTGADAITFASALDGKLISLTLGQMLISGDTTITGPTHRIEVGRGEAQAAFRIFELSSGVTVSMSNLYITGGKETNGGGILGGASSALTLTNTAFLFNEATADNGGAIDTTGSLNLTDCTFSNNHAEGFGGAISETGGGTIARSTFNGNSADIDGGAIENQGALTLINSTLQGNSAGVGGGVDVEGTMTISNCTIAGNSASVGGANAVGGGIFVNAGGNLTLNNSIVAGSTQGVDLFNTDVLSGSNNLIGDGALSSIATLTNTITGNPMLNALNNYGGLTQTMSLQSGSPAINKGSNALIPAGVTTDQRGTGFARKIGGVVDIGAFESSVLSSPKLVTTATGSDFGTATGSTLKDSATLSLGGGATTGTITFKLFNASNQTLDTEVVTVNGNGTYTTPTGYVATLVGAYHWTASYSGDTDNNPASDDGTSESVTVFAGLPTHFKVEAPANATQGVAFNITVTALDAYQNVVTGFDGAVTFSSSDAAAALPPGSGVNNGTGTFSVTLNTIGNQTVSASWTTATGTSDAIAVASSNHAPTITVPGNQTAYEDVDKPITGITVGDADGDNLTVKLTVTKGKLTVAASVAIGFTISGNGTASLTLGGTVAKINAVLATLVYRGNLNYSGADTLSVTAADAKVTSGPSTLGIIIKSAAEQATDLKALVKALQTAKVINSGQATALLAKLDLKNNSGDKDKVQSFIDQVNSFRKSKILTQAQADSLLGPANALLLSVSRR